MAEKERRETPQVNVRPGGGRGGPNDARLHAEKPKNLKETVLRLFKYLGRSRVYLIIIVFSSLSILQDN